MLQLHNITGKDSYKTANDCELLSLKVTRELIKPYLNRGNHLYIDNFYTSIQLIEELAQLNTGLCDIIREKYYVVRLIIQES